eukprot:jgi/Bigna1/46138/estExt_Genewise1.C_20186
MRLLALRKYCDPFNFALGEDIDRGYFHATITDRKMIGGNPDDFNTGHYYRPFFGEDYYRPILEGGLVSEELDVPTADKYTVGTYEDPEVQSYLKNSNIVEENGSKLAYVIGKLKELLAKPESRIILFSQWSMIFQRLVALLRKNSIQFVECRGNVHIRTKATERFNRSDDCKVIMLSLENAASGANLQKASHVILLDPCPGTKEEADAVESQAIGRAHRQGQEKRLTVIRIVMKDTIEEQLLERKEEVSTWRVEKMSN